MLTAGQVRLMEPEIDWLVKERAALAVIDRAVQEFGPEAVVGCISGGIDSVVVGAIARKHPALSAFLHIDTQTGVDETREYVEARVAAWGVPLMVRRSPVDYLDLVAKYGMLGPSHHVVYFNALKGRVFRAVGYELAPRTDQRVVLLSGARRQESAKRRKNVIPVRHDQYEKRLVWASPIWDWSATECRLYLAREGVPTNPVADLLHRSGECNCPAFAKKEELEELRLWYPEAAAKIDHAVQVAKENGVWYGWGEPVPSWFGAPEAGGLDEYLDPTCEEEACRSCPARALAGGGT